MKNKATKVGYFEWNVNTGIDYDYLEYVVLASSMFLVFGVATL